MNVQFENQGTATYLVYKIEPDDVLDNMSLGMITNNKIPGFAPAIFTQMDDLKFIKFNVSSKVSANQFFTGQVNKKRLLGVFRGIMNAMVSAEDYMIDSKAIMMDLEYIFADVSTCETVLICLPINVETREVVEPVHFFKNIMFSTQFDQTENCDYVAKIINYLNSSSTFSATKFKELLDGLDRQESKPAASQPAAAPARQAPVQQPVVTEAPKPVTPVVAPVQPMVQPSVQPQAHAAQKMAVPNAPVMPAQPKNAKGGMAIPGAPAAKQAQPVQAAPAGNEKKITMFDLLMHYNKENAELYKSQKAAGKNKAPAQTKEKKGAKAAPANASFAVPGQPAKVGFAVPGQQVQPVSLQAQASQAAQAAQAAAPKPITPMPTAQQPVAPVAPTPAFQQPVMPSYQAPAMPQGMPANFGETTVLGGPNAGETTVLNAVSVTNAPSKPFLVRVKNHERIYLNDSIFKIGKEKSYVDYFIGDNTAISRSHANVVCKNGEYYIVDQNSTNHTYVNGVMIQSNVETKLEHDAKIRLANEEFEFRMY